jgi:hypothetical protein
MSSTAQEMYDALKQNQEVFDNKPKFLDANEFLNKHSVAKKKEALEEDTVVDMGGTLKKKDFYKPQNLSKLRNYMISRKGVDYKTASDKDVVEDFVNHMRRFNTNIISTSGEVRHITNASEDDKRIAGDAYKLYDQLGNVFVNDGLLGAVDGVFDYIGAAVADPTNYLGLLTGGLGKASALGLNEGAKQLVKRTAIEAGQKAIKSGATREAAQKASQEAAERMAQRLVEKGVKGSAAKKLKERVALREKENFLYNAKKQAQKEFITDLGKEGIRKSLYATTALDASFAVLNDYQIQNVMLDVGAQEEYSLLQTGFSSLLGAVGGGAQLVGGKFKGASGLSDVDLQLRKAKRNAELDAEIEAASLVALPKGEVKRVASHINKTLDSWESKWKRGDNLFQTQMMPSELLHDIMLGPDGKGGLAKVFADNGMKLNKKLRVTDVMTNVLKQMPQAELQSISKRMQPLVGYTLGDTTTIAQELGDLIASKVRNGMQLGNVMSQTRKTIDAGVVHGQNAMANLVRNPQAKDAIEEEVAKATGKSKPARPFSYTQSVWRRLLVSSPATTALNVAGFSQFYLGQTMADVFTGSLNLTYGLALGGNFSKRGREALRVANVYKDIQAQKMRNLMDPYTTHDAYIDFLSQNKEVEKTLFETITGGIERSGKRFNLDPNNAWFKNTEAVTNAANRLTGVRVQDTFTKSQMFMTELDKFLRVKKQKSLKEVLNDGSIDLIDDSVVGSALDTTLKSVFSKNYTTDDQHLKLAAKFTENISNLPFFGTILPFGRFFNNVVATSYQWSVGGGVQLASAIAKKEKRNIETVEAFSRSLVGVTALGAAMRYDEERRQKQLGTFEIDTGGGTIVDARNTYPFSLWLAAGRALNLGLVQGEEVPKEVIKEFGEQIAVGQLASDAQFGNDITAILDTIFNQDVETRKKSIDAIAKFSGNYVAGFTRPLDAVNKLTGFITDTDAAKDKRRAGGDYGVELFSQNATKYFDNVIEAFTDKAETITGEELRVASRDGKIQDANPMAKLFGITVKPGRTSTEKVYSMAQMQPWTASERSQIAAYDTVFNETLAPVLETATDKLLRDPDFINADLIGKRAMLKSTLSDVKGKVRNSLKKYSPPEKRILAIKRKASSHGNKELRTKAFKVMRERFNFTGSVDDMGYSELQYFMDYIDYLKDIYE